MPLLTFEVSTLKKLFFYRRVYFKSNSSTDSFCWVPSYGEDGA